MNEIKVSINHNGLHSKKITFKYLTDTIDFNKHNIDIFINDKWRKYAGGDIERLFKIPRWLELRFWPTRKWSQPSQGDFFAWIALQREPCIFIVHIQHYIEQAIHRRHHHMQSGCIDIKYVRNISYDYFVNRFYLLR
jgi:hypothetical protein